MTHVRQWQWMSSIGCVMVFSWCAAVNAAPDGMFFNVRDYGAVGDGTTLDTQALQKAINTCAVRGGGTVVIPAGRYLTGTLLLRDHTTLRIEAGAVLLGSTELKDYPPRTPAFRSYTDVNYVDKSLIYAEKVSNIAIVGQGTIDGQGGAAEFKGKPYKSRPYLIRMIECDNVTIRDITLRDSPMWVQHYLACANLHINGITVHSVVNHNNDGIDIDCCDRVRIANCDINSGDDAIVLKSTAPKPCRHVTITNCTMQSRCNGFKCGTETSGGFEDITVSNCVIHDTRLAGIALQIVDGGSLQRVLVNNITMVNTRSPISIRLGNRARPYLSSGPGGAQGTFQMKAGMKRPGVGTLRDVLLSNIMARGANINGCFIAGLADHRIENVALQNVRMTTVGGGKKEWIDRPIPENADRYPECSMFGPLPAYGLYCRHVRNLRLDHVELDYDRPEPRPALVCDDVDGLRLEGFRARLPVGGDRPWRFKNVKDIEGDEVSGTHFGETSTLTTWAGAPSAPMVRPSAEPTTNPASAPPTSINWLPRESTSPAATVAPSALPLA